MYDWFIVHNWHILKEFQTEKGAKMSLRRRYKEKYPDAVVMSREEFNRTEPIVETKNLMTGKTIMIRASEKGTCCDPGTERYWSM